MSTAKLRMNTKDLSFFPLGAVSFRSRICRFFQGTLDGRGWSPKSTRIGACKSATRLSAKQLRHVSMAPPREPAWQLRQASLQQIVGSNWWLVPVSNSAWHLSSIPDFQVFILQAQMPEKSQEFLLKGVQLATNLISVAGAMQLAEAPYVGPRPLMKRLPNRRTEVILYTKKTDFWVLQMLSERHTGSNEFSGQLRFDATSSQA